MKFSILNPPAGGQFSKKNLGLILILVVLGSSVYSFNLNNPLFWDDLDWIVNNPFVHDFSRENFQKWFSENILAGIGQLSNYYRPFLLFTFTFNYVLGGENPIGYHLLSDILHLVNAVLIFSFLFRIFRSRFISFWTSLIWLVHPLQTEAVTYISGRGDPLNVFFMLLGLQLFIKTRGADDPRRFKSAARYLPLIVILLILALLSRETAIIFPFLLMAAHIAFISREKFVKSIKSAFIGVFPYFTVVAIYGILRLTVLNFENTLNFYSQNNLYVQSFSVRMYTFLNVLWMYAELMILPLGQHMERSVTIYTYFWNWPTVLSFLVLLTVLFIIYQLYKRDKSFSQYPKFEIPNSKFRVWFFAVSWFFANLLMTSGITPINAQLYEHWLYLAILGPLVLAVFYSEKIYSRSNNRLIRIIIVASLIAYSAFFSFLSVKRNILWGRPIEFFKNILEYEPESARINNNVGTLYYNAGDKDMAAEYYLKATQAGGNSFPQPYFNLGAFYQEKGDTRGAIVMYEKAVELDPNFPHPYPNLAVIYADQGDLAKAIEYMEKLKELQPQMQRVYYNLALAYIESGDYESARLNLLGGLKYGRSDPDTEPLINELMEKFKK